MEDDEAWIDCNDDDLWVFDKCILSRKLKYNCGPADMWVPKPDFYIVRPCVNLAGMSRGAQIRYLEKETTHLPPGHFWCEIFEGRHISVDFKLNNKSRTYSQDLTVEGFRDKKNPLWKFDRWIRVNDTIEFPKILTQLKGNYSTINCEFIGDKLIEVHLRQNDDMGEFNEIIPVWENETVDYLDDYVFIDDKDYKRVGFLKKR